MTGRGDNKIIRRSPNAPIKIGLTHTSPDPTISASNPAALTLSVRARILDCPHADRAVTLAAYKNPFGNIVTNPSYTSMVCVRGGAEAVAGERGWENKRIHINPCAQGRSVWGSENDLSEWMDFVTIPSLNSSETVTVHHTVRPETVQAAGVSKGEVYRATLTNRCLGAVWWCYGEKPEGPIGLKSGHRGRTTDDCEDDEGEDDREWNRGEDTGLLVLVLEDGSVDFEVV